MVTPIQGPASRRGCPVNAASYVGGGVAPGETVTIFGAAMGPSGNGPAEPDRVYDGRLDALHWRVPASCSTARRAPLLYVHRTNRAARSFPTLCLGHR